MIRVRCYDDHLGLLVVYPSGHLSVDLSCTRHFMSQVYLANSCELAERLNCHAHILAMFRYIYYGEGVISHVRHQD